MIYQTRDAYGRLIALPVAQRLWARVEKSETCWLWTGPTLNTGYGTIRHEGRDTLAHRVAYELAVGPIPNGLTIDHLCGNLLCCRPDHLEPVSRRENIRRAADARRLKRTACKAGHPLTPDLRRCLVCQRERDRLRYRSTPGRAERMRANAHRHRSTRAAIEATRKPVEAAS